MMGATLATGLYVPARRRVSDVVNHLAYGEREAPDQVVRTFGSRLTRAVPMDELLLQLAESLRKTMALVSAEIWTGSGGQLERSISLPERDPVRLSLTAAEESVVIRGRRLGVGLGGCLVAPSLSEGRAGVQLQVVPVAYSKDPRPDRGGAEGG